MEDGVCCCFRSKDDSVLRCRSLVLLAVQTFSAVVRFLLFSLMFPDKCWAFLFNSDTAVIAF